MFPCWIVIAFSVEVIVLLVMSMLFVFCSSIAVFALSIVFPVTDDCAECLSRIEMSDGSGGSVYCMKFFVMFVFVQVMSCIGFVVIVNP